MKVHNILTGKDKRDFSHARNRSFGSLAMAKSSITNLLNSDLIGKLDKILLKQALDNINNVIDNWDKQYCTKLFAKLNKEAIK